MVGHACFRFDLYCLGFHSSVESSLCLVERALESLDFGPVRFESRRSVRELLRKVVVRLQKVPYRCGVAHVGYRQRVHVLQAPKTSLRGSPTRFGLSQLTVQLLQPLEDDIATVDSPITISSFRL